MSHWRRLGDDEIAHLWRSDGDEVIPICGMDYPEFAYMLDSVGYAFDPDTCCERCQAINNQPYPDQLFLSLCGATE